MNLQETAKILAIIAAVFEKFHVDEFKVKVWFTILGHHEYRIVELATFNILSKPRDFAPLPGHINEEIRSLIEPSEDKILWGEAWNLIESCISRFGSYRPEVLKILPNKAIRALGGVEGYKDLCRLSTDQKQTFRAQFRQRYEDLKTQEVKEKLQFPKVAKHLEIIRNEILKLADNTLRAKEGIK